MRPAILAFSFLAPLLAQPAAVSPDTVVLTVHGRKYTRAEFEDILKAMESNTQTAVDKLKTAETFGRNAALANEARSKGRDKSPSVQAKLRIFETNLLSFALFEQMLAEVEKDEPALRKRYETQSHVAEERKLRHILLRTIDSTPTKGKWTPDAAKAKAEVLRNRITGGASFVDIAKAESEDDKTKANGGDLNYIRRPLLLPQLGDAAFTMKEGEVSQPVKTTDGYHLVLLEKIAPPKFELIRKALAYDLARERFEKQAATGVVLNPDYFGKK
ncbi:MAG: hypothetical protein FJW32_19435 [Acidobacteria bacterium]|nr:hypothetical protein [Acidobacteriota bacterium]